MRHDRGTFIGAGGSNLYYQSWHPQARPSAVLVLIHGLGGHSGMFPLLVEYLVARDYVVYGFDLRGHGRSSGQRGYINSWADFREDLRAFLKLIRTSENELPIFLLGHSLGSAIALEYVLHTKEVFSGVVLLAPALGKVNIPLWKLTLGQILSRVWPNFSLSSSIDLSMCSRNLEMLDVFAKDPLLHNIGTARLSTEFFKIQSWILARANELEVPLLILHGLADSITFAEDSRNFIEKVAFKDKELKEYPEVYHDIQNDPDAPKILADLLNWLSCRLRECSRS